MQATQQYLPFIETTGVLRQPEQLRASLEEHGYLFLRGIVPSDAVLRARYDMLEVCREAGWVRADTDLMDATWSGLGPFTENEPEYMAVYRKIIRLDSFNELPQQPEILALMASIVGGEVLAHRRRIGRVTFPQNVGQTTGIHQDWYYIRGTPQTYTLWTPLGDCPQQLGGVAVLDQSHRAGFIEHDTYPEKKYAAFGLDESKLPQGEWHAGDFQIGDALIFHSHTIHKALPNLTPDTLRLSTDNRYQLAGSEIEPGSLGSHYGL